MSPRVRGRPAARGRRGRRTPAPRIDHFGSVA